MSQLKAYNRSNQPLKNKAVKHVFVAGIGAVGGTLIKQVQNELKSSALELIGICNSKHVIWKEPGSKLSPENLPAGSAIDWNQIIEKCSSYNGEKVIFVDTTGSSEVADLYPSFLKNKIHIVTPSKLANSGNQSTFDELRYLADANGVDFLYETNVGAGLPIIKAVSNFTQTGDSIIEINGVLSGTMTYLFSELDKGEPFSKSVIKARTLGYAEPDPRDDLSGEDVVRKFMILARTAGFKVERSDVAVESLIPKELQQVDSTTFLEKLPDYDNSWKQKIEKATKSGKKLRYVGTFKEGKITIRVESVDKSSPIGQLKGTNNLVTIRTERYNEQPLIIQGPGAGKKVTAAGVLSDLLSIE